MILIPLEKAKDIQNAMDKVLNNLKDGARSFTRTIGWPSGCAVFEIYWRPQEHIWFLLNNEEYRNRYWFGFGNDDPTHLEHLSLRLEINSPLEGINRAAAGTFLKDEDGIIYLAHKGKLGGSLKGMTKENFLAYYDQESIQEVSWPYGKEGAIIIGRIESEHLPVQIAYFVHEVAKFKNLVKSGIQNFEEKIILSGFTPEFSGTRKYTVSGEIESNCDHGTVVNELHRILSSKNFQIGNNQQCDLFSQARDGTINCLFEVKSNISTTSIYCAIGQVMLHGASQKDPPMRVLVLPDEPTKPTRKALARLGIQIVTYLWDAEKPTFHGLNRVMKLHEKR